MNVPSANLLPTKLPSATALRRRLTPPPRAAFLSLFVAVTAFGFVPSSLAQTSSPAQVSSGDTVVGDMVLTSGQLSALQTPSSTSTGSQPNVAIQQAIKTWPGGIVPYVFDSSVTLVDQNFFLMACQQWQMVANVRFVPHTNQSDYITVYNSTSGNFSRVGVIGGSQYVYIQGWDQTQSFSIEHELGHTLGLMHEQQRSDRDTYVTIHPENIQSSETSNQAAFNNDFGKYYNTLNKGPYDFDSIMHYTPYDYSSKPGVLPSITANAPYSDQWGLTFGQYYGPPHLSVLDKSGMAMIYGPTFQPLSISTGADKVTRMIWASTSGQMSLWHLNPDGSYGTRTAVFGPYTDNTVSNDPSNIWHPTAVATGPDGKDRILWNNVDGRVMLWSVDNSFNYTVAGFGPYTDGAAQNKWSATALSVGSDNTVHLLWNNTDGRVMVWNVDASSNFTYAGFGPLTDGAAQNKWSATAIATGSNGLSHVVWNNADNKVMLWDVDSAFNVTNQATYGPYTDNSVNNNPGNLWSAKGISVAPDNTLRLMWSNVDRRMMFWNVDTSRQFTLAGFGPYTDDSAGPSAAVNLWSATAVSTGPDGFSHVLWNNTDNRVMLWNIDGVFNYSVAGGYGPYSGTAGP